MMIEASPEIRDRSRTHLDGLKEEDKSGLQDYETYKEMSAHPKRHMCEICKDKYAEYNIDQKKRLTADQLKKYEMVEPICTLSNEDKLKRSGIDLAVWKTAGGKEEEYDVAMIQSSPIKWAAVEFGWLTKGFDPIRINKDGSKLSLDRWYQNFMLNCSSQFKIFRAGRRIGKCLIDGTEVMTPTGPVEIQNLKPGDIIYAYNTDDDSVTETPVVRVINQGIQNVVDMKSRRRVVASCTMAHRWHTVYEDGGKKMVRHVDEFYKGIRITRKFVKIPMGDKDVPHAYAIGAFLGDGCSKERGTAFCISSENEMVPRRVSEVIGCDFIKTKSENYTYVLSNNPGRNNGGNSSTCEYYDSWIRDRYAHEKIIDINEIKKWNRKSCLSLLAGLLDTDGCTQVFEGSLILSWHTQSKSMRDAICWLCKVLFQFEPSIIIDDRDKYKNGPMWRICIKNNIICNNVLQEISEFMSLDKKKHKPEYLKLNSQDCLDSIGVVFDEDKTYRAQCWDIEIGTPDHLYLLQNGMVTHNTDAMVMSILWELYTNKNHKVLVIAPYEKQVERIFQRMDKLIEQSSNFKHCIKRRVKNPEVMELDNGSMAVGYSSGARTGSRSDKIRGEGADLIVLDECVVEGTLVSTPNGPVPIESIKIGDRVFSKSNNLDINTNSVLDTKMTGIKKCYRITTENGYSIEGTENHPVANLDGYVNLIDAEFALVNRRPVADSMNPEAVASRNDSCFFLERIVSKEYIGMKNVYNLTVENDNNYICNNIVTHNCDYMNKVDIEAIIAILADKPDVKIYASSTPTGKRSHFYDWATDMSQLFKEFHIFSHASPNYTKMVDNQFRKMYSTAGYEREILALFGNEMEGVFSNAHIESATKNYSLSAEFETGPREGWKYIIGVDWNGRAIGTHMVVVGLDPKTHKYRLVDKRIVKLEQYTADASIKTIISLFQYWKASFIYCDAGYGEVQIEIIKQTAHEKSNMALYNALQPVHMQGYQIVKDPMTGEEEKKPNKAFAVNLAANRMERQLLEIPADEDYKLDEDWGLIAQLRAFCVEKTSPTGMPTYTEDNEHTLTAYILAIMGFQMKMSSLGYIEYDNKVGHVPHPHKKDGVHAKGVNQREKEKRDENASGFIARNQGIDKSLYVQSGRDRYYDASQVMAGPNGVPMIKPSSRSSLKGSKMSKHKARTTF